MYDLSKPEKNALKERYQNFKKLADIDDLDGVSISVYYKNQNIER